MMKNMQINIIEQFNDLALAYPNGCRTLISTWLQPEHDGFLNNFRYEQRIFNRFNRCNGMNKLSYSFYRNKWNEPISLYAE